MLILVALSFVVESSKEIFSVRVYDYVRKCCNCYQVIENAPYVTTIETLNEHDCDFCVHGGEYHVPVDKLNKFDYLYSRHVNAYIHMCRHAHASLRDTPVNRSCEEET